MAGVAKDFEKRDWLLVAAAATLIAGYLGIGYFSVESKAPWYDEKLAASQLAQRAMASVRAEKLARGIAIAPGTWVSTGAITGIHEIRPGQRGDALFDGKIRVSCEITG